MAEGFRFIYLDLQVFMRALSGSVIQRCQNRKYDRGDVNDVMTGSVGRDLRKVSSLSSCLRRVELNFSVRGRRLTFGARRGLAAGVARGGGGGRWKSRHRKIVPLSLPLVEKPFNSKVIKSFVPELSRYVFFGFPMLSICALWTL